MIGSPPPADNATPPDGATRGQAAPSRGRPAPPDPPMLPLALGGTAVWAVLALVMLPLQHRLEAAGHGSWIWICVAGFLFGLPGTVVMVRHDGRRRRRQGR